MAKKYKVGQKITNDKGEKVVITSILPNGAATVNYASGSGKTGYAGVISGNMLTKYGLMPYSTFRVKEVEAEGLEWNDRNFSYDEYEKYIAEANGDEASALEKELVEARKRNLKKIDEIIETELQPVADDFLKMHDRPVDGTRHRRAYYNVYRYMIQTYSNAYGASDEFDLARAKVSVLYQFSEHAGNRNMLNKNEDGYDFTTGQQFGEAYSKAIELHKNPNTTYDDIYDLLGSSGLCPYDEYPNSSHGSHVQCQRRFAGENPDSEYLWPLPPPRI